MVITTGPTLLICILMPSRLLLSANLKKMLRNIICQNFIRFSSDFFLVKSMLICLSKSDPTRESLFTIY